MRNDAVAQASHLQTMSRRGRRFESKREIIRVRNPEIGATKEQWTSDHVLENEWQSFRTRKDRSLELTSVARECPAGASPRSRWWTFSATTL